MEDSMINSITDLTLVKSKQGKMSLRVVGEDGSQKALHSTYNPEAEAESTVQAFEYNRKGILVVLGLGLGYHIAELSRRFPEARIIVIEKLNEIKDLAKEHGPELESNVEIISGLPAEEALKEISVRQAKEGIVPISVFMLSSAVSAFPSYYRPILDSLGRTVNLKLWERLKYSKFNGNRLKVMMLNSDYFLAREIRDNLRLLGHDVVSINISGNVGGERVVQELIENILEFKPDFLLTVNHLGFDEEGALTSFLNSIEMPVAVWYVDSPELIVGAFEKNVSSLVSLFLWDRTYIAGMENIGFESVSYLPLGTDEKVFRPLGSKKHRKKLDRYSADIGFVANSMVDPVEDWFGKVDRGMHPLVEEVAEYLAGNTGSYRTAIERLPGMKRQIIEKLDRREKMNFEAASIWKSTLLYRLSLLRSLDEFKVHIHGDEGWKSIVSADNIKIMSPLNYYKELPFFYNACKINFNATSRQMNEAVNQRVFDVPACGAFLLTDNQESVHELFEAGREIIIYGNKDEIPELADYYFKNHDKRRAVAERGRERVLNEHTYRHRLNRLLEIMKKRYR